MPHVRLFFIAGERCGEVLSLAAHHKGSSVISDFMTATLDGRAGADLISRRRVLTLLLACLFM